MSSINYYLSYGLAGSGIKTKHLLQMGNHDYDQDEEVLTETRKKLEKPPLYKVLLHNDDFTTMEFVVFVLNKVFQRTAAEAVIIMLKVHNEGVGVAGIYSFEIANMKANKAMNMARAQEFPFLCTVEKE